MCKGDVDATLVGHACSIPQGTVTTAFVAPPIGPTLAGCPVCGGVHGLQVLDCPVRRHSCGPAVVAALERVRAEWAIEPCERTDPDNDETDCRTVGTRANWLFRSLDPEEATDVLRNVYGSIDAAIAAAREGRQ